MWSHRFCDDGVTGACIISCFKQSGLFNCYSFTNLNLCCSGQKTFQIRSVGRLKNDNNSHVITRYSQQHNLQLAATMNSTNHLQLAIFGFWMVLRPFSSCTLSHATDAVFECMRNRLRKQLSLFCEGLDWTDPSSIKIKLVWPKACKKGGLPQGGGGGGGSHRLYTSL